MGRNDLVLVAAYTGRLSVSPANLDDSDLRISMAPPPRYTRGRCDQAVWNRICQFWIDFLIVRANANIVGAVELDDSSHRASHRQDADARKSHALKSAGIPLIRWQVTKLPDVESIRSALAGLDGGGAVRCGANATALTSRAVPIR